MSRIKLAELLAGQFGNTSFEVTTTVHIDELVDYYDMCDVEIDLDDIHAKQQVISFQWHIDDVKQQRPDLTDDQCWDVLQSCRRSHDANIGMNWDVIDCVADLLFGAATETDETDDNCNSTSGSVA